MIDLTYVREKADRATEAIQIRRTWRDFIRQWHKIKNRNCVWIKPGNWNDQNFRLPTGNGTPVSGSLMMPAKLPFRSRSVGTVPTAVFTERVYFHSWEKKKKVLSRPLIREGPPSPNRGK